MGIGWEICLIYIYIQLYNYLYIIFITTYIYILSLSLSPQKISKSKSPLNFREDSRRFYLFRGYYVLVASEPSILCCQDPEVSYN